MTRLYILLFVICAWFSLPIAGHALESPGFSIDTGSTASGESPKPPDPTDPPDPPDPPPGKYPAIAS